MAVRLTLSTIPGEAVSGRYCRWAIRQGSGGAFVACLHGTGAASVVTLVRCTPHKCRGLAHLTSAPQHLFHGLARLAQTAECTLCAVAFIALLHVCCHATLCECRCVVPVLHQLQYQEVHHWVSHPLLTHTYSITSPYKEIRVCCQPSNHAAQ